MIRLVFLSLLILSNTALAASFDCQKADRVVDKTICSNKKLSELDEDMAAYYFKVRKAVNGKASDALIQGQRDWLRQRPKKCSPVDADCLIRLYKYRILELRRGHENLIPYISSGKNTFSGLEEACSFGRDVISDNTLVYAGGARAGKKISHSIDDSGHETTQFEVIVNSPDKPVALILGAYEPSVWNLSWTRGTKISAVVATGYYRQAVAGLPQDVPVLISSHNNNGPCGYLYVENGYLKKISRLSQKVFDKDVAMVHYAKSGTLAMGIPIDQNLKLYSSDDIPVDSFFDNSAPSAGMAGIEDLLRQGLIRKATSDDVTAWLEREAEANGEKLPPEVSRSISAKHKSIGLFNAYVILGQITIPAGLYGGRAVSFFLDEGVPYPKGDLGHSGLYDFSTMTCTGVRCPEPMMPRPGVRPMPTMKNSIKTQRIDIQSSRAR